MISRGMWYGVEDGTNYALITNSLHKALNT